MHAQRLAAGSAACRCRPAIHADSPASALPAATAATARREPRMRRVAPASLPRPVEAPCRRRPPPDQLQEALQLPVLAPPAPATAPPEQGRSRPLTARCAATAGCRARAAARGPGSALTARRAGAKRRLLTPQRRPIDRAASVGCALRQIAATMQAPSPTGPPPSLHGAHSTALERRVERGPPPARVAGRLQARNRPHFWSGGASARVSLGRVMAENEVLGPPPGCAPMMMTEEQMQKYDLKTGPDMFDVVDYKLFDKQEAIAEYTKIGFYSAFHDFREKIPVSFKLDGVAGLRGPPRPPPASQGPPAPEIPGERDLGRRRQGGKVRPELAYLLDGGSQAPAAQGAHAAPARPGAISAGPTDSIWYALWPRRGGVGV